MVSKRETLQFTIKLGLRKGLALIRGMRRSLTDDERARGRSYRQASLGVAVGSAAGGLLFDFAPLPGASFLLMTVLTLLGILLSLGLPNILDTQARRIRLRR